MAVYSIVRVNADPKRSFKPQDLYSLPLDDELEDEFDQDEIKQLYEEARVFRIPGIKYADQ